MICPECHAEYLNHIKECGDCGISLINASDFDLSIPEITWLPLYPFKGKIYADMAAELLDKEEIPYYLKMDWASSAFAIEAATIPGQVVQILVPKPSLEKAAEIVRSITGHEN